jgi:hypothetical protein
MAKVLESRCGKYRFTGNECDGYAFEVLAGGRWHSFGGNVSEYRIAEIKLGRLAGTRDTDTPVREWEAFYRVNV